MTKIIHPKPNRPKNYRDGKKTLVLTPQKKGESLDKCATYANDYVCCNVHVLKSVKNCPYDCSYCFLQNYLNDGTLSVVTDIQNLMKEVHTKTNAQPWRFFRIGNWELGDSLALEDTISHAKHLITEFAKTKNAVLELKTKSDCVNNILSVPHNGRTVVSWSVNPESIVQSQEHRTASLKNRLAALEKVQNAGYLTGLHFDPMIVSESWETDYKKLVNQIASVANPHQIAWISIGSLRFNPEMKDKMKLNFPSETLSAAEMVLGPDGKMRYPKPLRITLYQTLYQALRQKLGPDPFIYLCMERWDVWKKVMGTSPESTGHLDYLMTHSLHTRFPGLVHEPPQRHQYEQNHDLPQLQTEHHQKSANIPSPQPPAS